MRLLLPVLVLVCVASACPSPSPSPSTEKPPQSAKSRLTLGVTSEPTSLCPLFADSGAASEVQGLLFRDLVRITPQGHEADLAARVPAVGDGAVVDASGRFVVDWVLKDDAVWSDGVKVTAADVVAGFVVAADPNQPTTGGRDLAEKIESVTAVDATHVRVIWKQPQPSFADPRVHRVLPAHKVLGKDGRPNDFAKNGFCNAPIGNGAFRVVEVKAGAHIVFGRNPFSTPQARLDELVVKFFPATDALQSALLAGDVDATFPAGGLTPAEAGRVTKGQPALTQTSAAGTTWVHLDFRLDDAWLKDPRVRRALAMAVDRKSLAGIAGGADVDESYLPPQHWGHVALPERPFDRAGAEKLLDEAGWKRPAPGAVRVNDKGETLRLELAAASGQKDTETLLQMMQAMWRDAGVDVVLDLKPLKVFFAENAKKRKLKHMWFYTWTIDETSTGMNLWRADRIPGVDNGFAGQNLPGWQNAEVTQLLIDVDASVDRDLRRKKLVRVQELFVAEVPAVSFWFRRAVVVVRADVVGLQPTGTLTPMAWNAATWTRAPP